MFKYTYILSDSYRQNTPFIHNSAGDPRQYLDNPNIKPLENSNRKSIASTYFPNKLLNIATTNNRPINPNKGNFEISVRKFNYQINGNASLKTEENCMPPSIIRQVPNNNKKQIINEQKCLKNRLTKLTDLGERHSQALRQVQLQNKLKAITNKYKEKSIETHQSQFKAYQNYKDERKQLKTEVTNQMPQKSFNQYSQDSQSSFKNHLKHDYSFNILPQTVIQQNRQKEVRNKVAYSYNYDENLTSHHTPVNFVQAENDITRNKVKQMVANHLVTAKINKDRFNQHAASQKAMVPRNNQRKIPFDSFQIQKIQNESEKGRKAVQKLSSLQQKIKASVQPFLNI